MAEVDVVEAKVLVSINGRFLETSHLVDCTINDIEAFKQYTLAKPFMEPSKGSIRGLVEGVWRMLLWYADGNICVRFIRFYKTTVIDVEAVPEVIIDIPPRALHLEIRWRNRPDVLMGLYDHEVVTSITRLVEQSAIVSLPLTQRRGPVFFTVRFQSEYLEPAKLSRLGQAQHDAVLLSSDGRSIPVHRHVLMAHSPVFRAMFESGMKECVTGECRITGISGEVLQLMVDYMLRKGIGFVEDVDVMRQLLVAADMYNIDLDNFKARCESRFMFTIREGREKDLGQLADQFGLGLLKKTLEDYCAKKKAKVGKRKNVEDLTADKIFYKVAKPSIQSSITLWQICKRENNSLSFSVG